MGIQGAAEPRHARRRRVSQERTRKCGAAASARDRPGARARAREHSREVVAGALTDGGAGVRPAPPQRAPSARCGAPGAAMESKPAPAAAGPPHAKAAKKKKGAATKGNKSGKGKKAKATARKPAKAKKAATARSGALTRAERARGARALDAGLPERRDDDGAAARRLLGILGLHEREGNDAPRWSTGGQEDEHAYGSSLWYLGTVGAASRCAGPDDEHGFVASTRPRGAGFDEDDGAASSSGEESCRAPSAAGELGSRRGASEASGEALGARERVTVSRDAVKARAAMSERGVAMCTHLALAGACSQDSLAAGETVLGVLPLARPAAVRTMYSARGKECYVMCAACDRMREERERHAASTRASARGEAQLRARPGARPSARSFDLDSWLMQPAPPADVLSRENEGTVDTLAQEDDGKAPRPPLREHSQFSQNAHARHASPRASPQESLQAHPRAQWRSPLYQTPPRAGTTPVSSLSLTRPSLEVPKVKHASACAARTGRGCGGDESAFNTISEQMQQRRASVLALQARLENVRGGGTARDTGAARGGHAEAKRAEDAHEDCGDRLGEHEVCRETLLADGDAGGRASAGDGGRDCKRGDREILASARSIHVSARSIATMESVDVASARLRASATSEMSLVERLERLSMRATQAGEEAGERAGRLARTRNAQDMQDMERTVRSAQEIDPHVAERVRRAVLGYM